MDVKTVSAALEDSIRVKQALKDQCAGVIAQVCETCVQSLKRGGTIFLCGNGGSFTDAQHIVGELIGRYAYDRPALAGVTLGSNFASLTAIGNDYGYEDIFAREVDALVKTGDVVIGLSTSGGSRNVIKALEHAKAKGAHAIGWTGGKLNTPMDAVCGLVLHVPSTSTPRIQECHICVGHILAGAVESALHARKA